MNISELLLCLVLFLPRIVSDMCAKNQWDYLENLQSYLLPIYQNVTFVDAQIYCEKLGGQLLTLRDDVTPTTLSYWYLNRSEFDVTTLMTPFWMGLAKETDQYLWMTGSPKRLNQDRTHEVNTADVFKDRTQCLVVTWVENGTWAHRDCSLASYFICQAEEPCSSRPVMRLNNETTRLENDMVLITNEQNIDIECFLRGYADLVTQVKIQCDYGDVDNRYDGEKSANLSIHVNFYMHGKKCVCQSIYRGAKRDESEITINFQSSPLFINERDNDQIILINQQDRVVVSVDIYSNPNINVTVLYRNGNPLNVDNYVLIIYPDGEGISKVKVILDYESADLSGSYVLTFQNGIGGPLAYRFYVKDMNKYVMRQISEDGEHSTMMPTPSSSNLYVVMAAGIIVNLIITGIVIALTLRADH